MDLKDLIHKGETDIKPILPYFRGIQINIILSQLSDDKELIRVMKEFQEWKNDVLQFINENHPKKVNGINDCFKALQENDYNASNFDGVIAFLRSLDSDVQQKDEIQVDSDIQKVIKIQGSTYLTKSNDKSPKVLIINGHEDLLSYQLEGFLRNLGIEPFFLHKQPYQGRTVIEKLEVYQDFSFAIVLYTAPNNVIKISPNVLFEHGYLTSKLGRNRVCALVEGHNMLPSDLAGIIYIPVDGNGGWKIMLAKEMKAVGLNVDLNKL